MSFWLQGWKFVHPLKQKVSPPFTLGKCDSVFSLAKTSNLGLKCPLRLHTEMGGSSKNAEMCQLITSAKKNKSRNCYSAIKVLLSLTVCFYINLKAKTSCLIIENFMMPVSWAGSLYITLTIILFWSCTSTCQFHCILREKTVLPNVFSLHHLPISHLLFSTWHVDGLVPQTDPDVWHCSQIMTTACGAP